MTDYEIDILTRADRELITAIVPEDARVLDLGCGDGGLLAELIEKKAVRGRGIDIDESNLVRCISRGLTVAMSDIDQGLVDYPPQSFDYVILNQTLQVIRRPEMVIREMLRVGHYAIVGFPNFGYWRLRWDLFSQGRMPKSSSLPFEWYDTPNIHQLTIEDFREFCGRRNIGIIREEYFMFGKWRHSAFINPLANLFAVTGMFVLEGNRQR